MTSMIAAIAWVFAATFVAFLPTARQRLPGIVLLLIAPGIVLWLGSDHGWMVAGLGLAAVLSMFRRPLVYYLKRLRRQGDLS